MPAPRSAWRTVELDVPTRKYRTPRVYEQTISLAGRSLRQLFVQDLGHEEPTILLSGITDVRMVRVEIDRVEFSISMRWA